MRMFYKYLLLFINLNLTRCFRQGLVWLPLGSKTSLPSITPLKIANKKYVIWKNSKNDKWSVLRDVCSHRLAPLSRGRIDETSGCIECPYHGWQFKESGECVKVPQAKKSETGKNVNSIKVMETGDILWGDFEIDGMDGFYEKPNKIYPELDNVNHVISRELPYSFYFLVENFMDPAHIPFAHHGLQGKRSDGINIPMKVLSTISDSKKLEIHFEDRIMGKMRKGVVSFVSPAYYHFRVKNEETGVYQKQLMVLITPVSDHKSRIHLVFLGASVPNKLPKWISHSFANKFLETDIWLHDCEISANSELISNKTVLDLYDTPTSSDIGPISWNKWWKKHLSDVPIFSNNYDNKIVELSPKQQKDRTKHIESCLDCQKALKVSKKLKYGSYIFLLAFKRNPIVSLISFLMIRFVSKVINNLVYGEMS